MKQYQDDMEMRGFRLALKDVWLLVKILFIVVILFLIIIFYK